MFAKAVIICSVVAAAVALTPGYLDGALALGAQSEHTVRGFHGLSSVSKQAKNVVSPYSSVQKHDVRVTNDGVYGYAAPHVHPGYAGHGYAAPLAHGYAAPHHGYAAPLAHGYASPLAHGYAAPHHGYASPYATPIAHHHGYAAGPLGYAHSPVAKVQGLGVAYSPAFGIGAVATHTFSGHGVHYGY